MLRMGISMKKILFVINTLGGAGAENALLTLINKIPDNYEISLYVLTGQGELIHRVPDKVRLCNKTFDDSSVLSKRGKRQLAKNILKAMFRHGAIFKNIGYLITNIFYMLKNGKIYPDKLLWKVLSDGGDIIHGQYDLAVAYLEGGSTYYVMDHIKAHKKVAFLHIDYSSAGYNRKLDRNCYLKYDKIYTVSREVEQQFLKVYPECNKITEVFENLIDQKKIRERANLSEGFEDDFDGTRILTVGRLTKQKAYEVSVDAMKILKDRGIKARWYVLGEGEERKTLESQIEKLKLKKDFLLLGATSNPYPYYKQTDLYVHASRFEGKSIAIQEAQTLGCAILVSDCSGNREQIVHGLDGRMCKLDSKALADEIEYMINHPAQCEEYRKKSLSKDFSDRERIEKFLELCNKMP